MNQFYFWEKSIYLVYFMCWQNKLITHMHIQNALLLESSYERAI
jgi:hypothetical protein